MKKRILLLVMITVLFFGMATVSQAAPYTWKNVQIVGGGFIPGIIYSQAESGLVYARTDMGGAYRLNTATGKWVPLTDWIGWDDWNLTGIASMAADPVDPERVYMAVGTYTNDWTSQNGAIMRSADRGATWQTTMLPFKIGGNMPGRGCGERMAVDPNKNSIIYFGAPGNTTTAFGLWKSTDYGATWNQVTNFPNPGDYIDDPADTNGYLNQIQGIYWVVFDKRTGTTGNATQTIYVGVGDKDGTCIYRTVNGGTSWELVPGQETMYPCPHKGVLDTVNGYLYVAYSDNGGPYSGSSGDVWRLTTATGVWTRISPIPGYPDLDEACYFGYSGLTIDRQHPSTIMVSAYSSWWPDTIFWRSTDCGATWTKIWDWTRYPSRSFRYTMDISIAPWLDWGPPTTTTGRPGAEVFPKLGWMTESLEIDPFNSDKMMYGTGATIYGSDNLTAWDAGNKILITVKAAGLEETSVLDLVSPPSGAPLLSGLGDICGFRHDNVDIVPIDFYKNPQIATTSIDYAELSPAYMIRVGNGDAANSIKSASVSTDGGTTWVVVSVEPAGITGGGTCGVSAAGGGKAVWAPKGTSAVYYTTSGGKSWTASAGIPAEAVVGSDRVNANKFYGFKNGTFYVSTDGGITFIATAATGLPATGKFKAMPGIEGDIWLAGGTESGVYGLWHSVNSGSSFTKLSNVEEADTIGFGKAAAGQTYMALYTSAQVGGVRGIFRSIDAGLTWVRINDDLHQWAWTGSAITGDPRIYGRVYIGTNGRGIIYGDEVTQ